MKNDEDVFSDVLHAAPGAFALLIDSGGPVIAGSLGSASSPEAQAELAAAALDVSADAARAERHLGIGALTAVGCESVAGAIGLGRVGDCTAMVGAPAPALPGRVRLLLGRVMARGATIAVRV